MRSVRLDLTRLGGLLLYVDKVQLAQQGVANKQEKRRRPGKEDSELKRACPGVSPAAEKRERRASTARPDLPGGDQFVHPCNRPAA